MKAPKGNVIITINKTYPRSRYARNLKEFIILRRDKIRINVKKENITGTVISIKNRLIANKKDDR
jgi:hypothetical protein